jgi:hypothetical protein
MRLDDPASAFDDLMEPGMDLPFDAELGSLHEELASAGQHARRTLFGRTQPTRLFSNQLRAHLLGAASAPGATRSEAVPATRMELRAADTGRPLGRPEIPEAQIPVARTAQVSRLFTVPPRTLLALLTIAGMAGVLAVGALSGTFGPTLP